MARKTFTQAVTAFEEDASLWLSTQDQPALVAMYALAEELDSGDMVPALVAQFGLTYRNLLNRAPVAGADEDDPLEAILVGRGK